jgi:hypothetical protein
VDVIVSILQMIAVVMIASFGMPIVFREVKYYGRKYLIG